MKQIQYNVMERRAIPDLLDKKYYIPEYQRGYRWEKKQVEDLMDDLYAFFSGDTKGQFYCLQPIVVKKKNIDGEDDWYEVIDGQQRLTTLLILMHVFDQLNAPRFGKPVKHDYTIRYATRPQMQSIFDTILLTMGDENRIIVDKTENTWNKFIDSHYIYNAATYILDWFQNDDARKSSFGQYLYNGVDTDKKSVQVVWYETYEDKDPHDIFNRMNSLKVGLSCSELIRSLFLSSCTHFNLGDMDGLSESLQIEVKNERFQQKLSSINEKWDEMEQHLRDEHFQAFLTSREVAGSRNAIGLLFDLISGKYTSKNIDCKYKLLNKDDDLYTYLYVREMVKEDNDAWTTWLRILNAYEKLCYWYHDRDLYHRIGFLNAVAEDGKKDDVVCQLLANEDGKLALRESVIKMISETMKLPLNKETQKPIEKLSQLSYDNDVHYKYIKQLLLLYNVETCRLLTEVAFFSFEHYRYKKDKQPKSWTLEHIHAQNSDCLPETNKDAWYEWIDCNLESLYKLSLGDSELLSTKSSLINLLEKNKHICKTNDFTFINIKGVFDEVADFYAMLDKQADKAKPVHQLSNLALLTDSQNSMVNKSAFEVKRQRICNKIAKGEYYPICTQKVFLKLYDNESMQIHSWSQQDRLVYFEDIKAKLREYIPEEAFAE